MGATEVQRLSVKIYQLADDRLFKQSRTDGSGWDWGWADWERDWMSATPYRNAYRCLPLTIINQTGWWIKNPVGFTATWLGSKDPGDIVFDFDSPDQQWAQWINSQFGEGIITWNTPFLFRTEPAGSRLLICGPTNYFRRNVHPLTALIESDWMTMSFTMNYKIMNPHEPVRFEAGEPLFQAIPLISNICADLEAAEVRYQKLHEDPAMDQAYHDWATGRAKFHQAKARKEVKPDQWQKDYFQGKAAAGQETPPDHRTKVKAPRILLGPAQPLGPPANVAESLPRSPGPALDRHPARRRPSARRRPERRRLDSPPGSDRGDRRLLADSAAPGLPSHHLASNPTEDRPAACPLGMGRTANATPSTQTEARSNQAQPQPRAEPADQRRPGSPASTTADRPARIDDNHRRWIAENLMLESPAEMIYQALISGGLDPQVVESEINLAMSSPYLRGADQLRNRLKKRDWLLATYRRINRLTPEANIIPRRDRLDRTGRLHRKLRTE